MAKIRIRHEVSGANNDKKRSNPFFATAISQFKFTNFFSMKNSRKFIYAMYVIFGIFFFILLFTLYDVYILHLKVETAVVNAPMKILAAPVAGYIRESNISQGDHTHKGDVLMKLENIELERSASLAKFQVEEDELNVKYLKDLLNNEQEKMNLYRIIGQNRLTSFNASYELSKHALKQSKSNLLRIKSLKSGHYVTDADHEKALLDYKISESRMLQSFARKNIENQSVQAIIDGMYFTGDKLEGSLSDISAKIRAADARLALEKRRADIYENLLNKEKLVSPFDGEVIEIYKSSGNTTNGMEPVILLIQHGAHKTIMAWLTQSEITYIRLASEVKVYIPSKGIFFHGKVARVNRTSGFLDEIKAQFRWRDLQIDRTASVDIEIDPNESEKFNSSVLAGMPATVYFRKT